MIQNLIPRGVWQKVAVNPSYENVSFPDGERIEGFSLDENLDIVSADLLNDNGRIRGVSIRLSGNTSEIKIYWPFSENKQSMVQIRTNLVNYLREFVRDDLQNTVNTIQYQIKQINNL